MFSSPVRSLALQITPLRKSDSSTGFELSKLRGIFEAEEGVLPFCVEADALSWRPAISAKESFIYNRGEQKEVLFCPQKKGLKKRTDWGKGLVKSVEYNSRSSRGPKVEEVKATRVSEDDPIEEIWLNSFQQQGSASCG